MMASRTSGAVDLRGVERSLEQWQEPGAADLCELLQRMVDDGVSASSQRTMQLDRLKQAVYRLRIGSTPDRTLVLKRHAPAVAQADRLLAERWLPALGLGDGCPRLVAAAAERAGCWVWHVYEDLGDENLATQRLPWRLAAAVDCIAELHTRAAGHALLPEVRWRARDHGAHFFTANLGDAIAALDALATPPCGVPREFAGARERLLCRLHRLREDAPRRVRLMQEVGGPDTLLHGDLWPKNVFVFMAANGPRARLIDWDHVGAGPFSYDLSTFLYQSAAEERPWIVRRYRDAVERAGWRLPGTEELNLLFHTAESARYAHCILFDAIAALHDGAEWGIIELMDYQRWLEALRPPLQERGRP
jgi:hypothetical protein